MYFFQSKQITGNFKWIRMTKKQISEEIANWTAEQEILQEQLDQAASQIRAFKQLLEKGEYEGADENNPDQLQLFNPATQ